ncbi:hypothetical protein ACFU5O_02085 [Streptomyces sp. NPDC057445]|uniref:hypothetical protein n=1 Tax=Streptomyces sp. NPDC057445 TaxID=3346136 RepID=UPI00367DB863
MALGEGLPVGEAAALPVGLGGGVAVGEGGGLGRPVEGRGAGLVVAGGGVVRAAGVREAGGSR